jgi:glycogen debranching enzyme-like protein
MEAIGQLAGTADAREPEEQPKTQGARSVVPSIADAIVIKDGDVFLLTKPGGSVPLEGPHGYGLYCDDCRFLDGYVLRLAGQPPVPLAASAAHGYEADFQLTNPEIRPPNGVPIPQETLGIHGPSTAPTKSSRRRSPSRTSRSSRATSRSS